MSRIRIGIDVGGTNAAGVALAAGGRVVASARHATRIGPAGVIETVRGLVADMSGGHDEVASVGVGIPGIVADGIVRHAVNLDVREMSLATALRDALGVPVAVENDVRAAALGAHAARGGSLAYLNLGTGVAAGFVVDGRVHRGSAGAAGEIGHISIDPAGPTCTCGQRGCIEAFAGGAAIARLWSGTADPVPARAVFDAAETGDARAIRIRDDAVRAMAAAVRILVLAVDAESVVLGGGVARQGERLRDLVAGDLDRAAAMSPFLAELDIPARIGFAHEDAPARGAALLIPDS